MLEEQSQIIKSPNTMSIVYSLEDQAELFIEEHAKNLEQYHRIGLNSRISQMLFKWSKTQLDLGKPLKIEKFSRVVQNSTTVRQAIEEFNNAQLEKRIKKQSNQQSLKGAA
jgi:biotin-(acetyl-CoA carboxylase) ligase